MFKIEKITIIILSILILILSMFLILQPQTSTNNEPINNINMTLEEKIQSTKEKADETQKQLIPSIITITIIGLIIILFIVTQITILNSLEQIIQQKRE